MQRHLHLVARPKAPRPAKVIQLDVRRQARLEAQRRHTPQPPMRPVA